MGMAAPDVVLFVVGFLLFGGAVTALVVSGGPAALGGTGGTPTGIYTLEFPTTKVDVAKQSVGDFSTAAFTTPVNLTNVATLHYVITCNDPLPGATYSLNYQITIQGGVTAPGGRVITCAGASTIDLPVTSSPAKTTTAAASPEDATKQAPTTNATLAQGTYTIKVTGTRGGGIPATIPAPGPTAPSGTIAMTADVWSVKATVVPK